MDGGGEGCVSVEQKAEVFAEYYHAGQQRKYTGEPYIYHPREVAEIVRTVPHTPAMICASYLHDTVEDTDATLEDIERVFGNEVATLVEMLTDISLPEDGNRAKRKAIDRAHTALASPAAKTIKLADLISNTKSIVQHDPKFAAIYLAEKLALLEVLRDGDKTLWDQAFMIACESVAAMGH